MSEAEKGALRAVVYVRASLDASGKRESVERQEVACRALAVARGWSVVEVVSDNSISAYGEKERPGWRRVLAMMEGREVEVVVAWHVDRLTRSMTELEAFILRAEESGVGLATASGDIDLMTDAGRMVARILAAVARAEVERKAARQTLANGARARAGKPHKGGVRAFGYARDGVSVVEEEAAAIRDAAARVLEGEAVSRIATEWGARGLVSSRAGESVRAGQGWSPSGVARLLQSPRYAGRRIYNGEDVGEGDWEPILTLETSLALRGYLGDPGRRLGPGMGRKAGSLLSGGLARCGVCGGPIMATATRGRVSYRCRAGTCVFMPRDIADGEVAAHVVAALSSPEVLGRLAPEGGGAGVTAAREALDTARGRLDGLAGAYAAGAIDLGQLETASAALRTSVAASEEVLAAVGRGSALEGLVGAEDVADVWEEMPLPRARAVVAALFEVTLYKHPRSRARPVVWGEEEVAAAVRVEWV